TVIGQSKWDVDTPALLLDLDIVERNIAAMADVFRGSPIKLRPHAKTHKSPRLALMQIAAGAIGITVAKLGEAEVMAAAGVDNLLISSEIVGPAKVARLIGLARQVNVLTVVDDLSAARIVAEAAESAGVRIPALIDLDTGHHRTGIVGGAPALALAKDVARLRGLNLIGLQGYEGHLQHIEGLEERKNGEAESLSMLRETRRMIEAAGIEMSIVSTGGTGTHRILAEQGGVTEIQAGSYVVMDTHYASIEGVQFGHALTCMTTVLSKTKPNRCIIDAGHKTLSLDSGPSAPKDLPGARYIAAGDEHGVIEYEDGHCLLSVGDRVEMLPRHCDPTINLHDWYHVTRGDTVVALWPVAARGRVQ
ncbi:MAG: DSD1 family PLP-dependent enzyme, partial [Chloroflexota bacterium]